MILSGEFHGLIDKMFSPAMTAASIVSGTIASINIGKNTAKAVLDARYNLLDNNTNMKHSFLLRRLRTNTSKQ